MKKTEIHSQWTFSMILSKCALASSPLKAAHDDDEKIKIEKNCENVFKIGHIMTSFVMTYKVSRCRR